MLVVDEHYGAGLVAKSFTATIFRFDSKPKLKKAPAAVAVSYSGSPSACPLMNQAINVRGATMTRPETFAQERERVQRDLHEQEETVRSWLTFYRRADIAADIANNRAHGLYGCKDGITIDW